MIGLAETGSGKTGAFAIPILQALLETPQKLFALILTPTRELAYQISEQFEALGLSIGVKCGMYVLNVGRVSKLNNGRLTLVYAWLYECCNGACCTLYGWLCFCKNIHLFGWKAPPPIDIWADNSKIRIIHVLVLSRIKHLVSMTKVKLKNIVFPPSIEQ